MLKAGCGEVESTAVNVTVRDILRVHELEQPTVVGIEGGVAQSLPLGHMCSFSSEA